MSKKGHVFSLSKAYANNQTEGMHKAIQTGIGLVRSSCSRKPVSQLRGLNEVGFQPVLAAGIPKGLGQVGFPCIGWVNEGQVTVGIYGVQ